MTLPIFELATHTAIDQVVRETHDAQKHNLIQSYHADRIRHLAQKLQSAVEAAIHEARRGHVSLSSEQATNIMAARWRRER